MRVAIVKESWCWVTYPLIEKREVQDFSQASDENVVESRKSAFYADLESDMASHVRLHVHVAYKGWSKYTYNCGDIQVLMTQLLIETVCRNF